MIFKLVLKGFKLKKVECWAKKNGSTGSTGCASPVEDRLCFSGRGPVEGGEKVSLSLSGLLFPVKVEP